MIVFMYRWKIVSGKEQQFQDNWAVVTKTIRDECGSFGSRLHVADNGEYVGYAQWPDSETREACEVKNPAALEARRLMREAVEISYPDQVLQIKSDFLIHPAP